MIVPFINGKMRSSTHLALVAALLLFSCVALVGIGYALSASYEDTIEDKTIDVRYMTIGSDYEFTYDGILQKIEYCSLTVPEYDGDGSGNAVDFTDNEITGYIVGGTVDGYAYKVFLIDHIMLIPTNVYPDPVTMTLTISGIETELSEGAEYKILFIEGEVDDVPEVDADYFADNGVALENDSVALIEGMDLTVERSFITCIMVKISENMGLSDDVPSYVKYNTAYDSGNSEYPLTEMTGFYLPCEGEDGPKKLVLPGMSLLYVASATRSS